jgi:hydrogenase maturation protease
MPKALVVCVGSTVMRDDGVGFHVLERVKKSGTNTDFADLGTDIFRLRLHYNDHNPVIIIDALRGGGNPGDVLVFSSSEFENKLEGKIRHAHLLGVLEGINIMREVDDKLKTAEIFLIGIVADTIDKGLSLTPIVQKAIPKAANTISSLLRKFN